MEEEGGQEDLLRIQTTVDVMKSPLFSALVDIRNQIEKVRQPFYLKHTMYANTHHTRYVSDRTALQGSASCCSVWNLLECVCGLVSFPDLFLCDGSGNETMCGCDCACVCTYMCVCVCVDVGERERDMLLWISMKWTLYYHLLEVTKQQTR